MVAIVPASEYSISKLQHGNVGYMCPSSHLACSFFPWLQLKDNCELIDYMGAPHSATYTSICFLTANILSKKNRKMAFIKRVIF